jgi:hypothetical protein
MTNGTARYMFAGHAIGAAARFHRLDEAENLNHVIPTLGASALPVTGGRSEARASGYRYDVDAPRRRCLFSVGSVECWVEGRGGEERMETELSVEVSGVDVVEKLHIDAVRLHLLSMRTPGADATVRTNGSAIEGMRLGNVQARVILDDEPLAHTGTAADFIAWHDLRGRALAQHGEYHCGTVVREIQLAGPDRELQEMAVEGHTIRWKGFGRIILGEIHVKGHERRVTMVRLAMGSDAGGTATLADGQSNGAVPVG